MSAILKDEELVAVEAAVKAGFSDREIRQIRESGKEKFRLCFVRVFRVVRG